jgi:hypothetical protein
MTQVYIIALIFSPFLVGLAFLIGRAITYGSTAPIRRALLKARRVPVGEVKDGNGQVVKITGRVTCAGVPLTAPLTKRPCVYYEVVVEDFIHPGMDGRDTDVVEETQSIDFFLSDETGRALIRSQAMTVNATKRVKFALGPFDDMIPELKAFLERHGREIPRPGRPKRLKAEERIVGVDEAVTVLGLVRREPDPDPTSAGIGYRDGPKRAVLEAPPGGRVLVSDEPAASS